MLHMGKRRIAPSAWCVEVSAEFGAVGSVVEQLADAADAVGSEREARAVMSALGETPGLTKSAVAPDVLARLLPDDEVVELPALAHVKGGPVYRAVKRAFDVVSCSCALVLLAVPMAAIALRIKRESPGPAIYVQTRVGKGGRLFKVYKFRSMYVDAEARGAQWAQGEDPRVTPFGRKLRNSRLASVIIGTPGDGESTKSFSRSANSSLDLQLCERRPGLCCFARTQYKRFQFLSVVVFRDARGVFNRTFTRISSLVPSAPLRGYAEGCSSFLSISKAVRCNDGGECCRRVA